MRGGELKAFLLCHLVRPKHLLWTRHGLCVRDGVGGCWGCGVGQGGISRSIFSKHHGFSPSLLPHFLLTDSLGCLFSDELSPLAWTSSSSYLHSYGCLLSALSLLNLLTSGAPLPSLQTDFSTCALDWTLLDLFQDCAQTAESKGILIIPLFLFMSLVEFDPIDHVFAFEVLSSLRDSFRGDMSSWCSSSWRIFCSPQSLCWPLLLRLPLIWWGGGTPGSIFCFILSRHTPSETLPTYPFALNCHLYEYGTQIHSFSPDFIPGFQNDLSIAFWTSPLVFYSVASNSVRLILSSFFSPQAKPVLHVVNITALCPVIPTGKLTVIFDSAISFFSVPNWWTCCTHSQSVFFMTLLSLLLLIYFRLSSFLIWIIPTAF